MAISVLGSGAGGTVYGSTTSTVSINAGSGTDRVLYVWLWNTVLAPSAVTYAGASMTLVHSNSFARLFRLVNPASGTNTLAATHDSASLDYVFVALSGVDQTTPNGTISTTSGSSSSPGSASITVATDGLALAFLRRGYALGGGAPTITAPSTLRGAYRNSASENGVAGGSRTSTGTVAWSIGSSVDWFTAGMLVNAAPVPGIISGDIGLDPAVAAGALTVATADMAGGVTLADALAGGSGLGMQSGIVSALALRNWSGSLQTSVTIPVVTVCRLSDGVQVLTLTNQVTHASTGDLTITSTSLIVGTWYMVIGWNADGSSRFAVPLQATA